MILQTRSRYLAPSGSVFEKVVYHGVTLRPCLAHRWAQADVCK